jgi:hypothetical protein
MLTNIIEKVALTGISKDRSAIESLVDKGFEKYPISDEKKKGIVDSIMIITTPSAVGSDGQPVPSRTRP